MAVTDQDSINSSFAYDAFISYRHVARDRKWAEWLITALETYRVPRALQKRHFPRRLHKVFRDEDEIPTSPDLNDQIKQALNKSRALIVICSRLRAALAGLLRGGYGLVKTHLQQFGHWPA